MTEIIQERDDSGSDQPSGGGKKWWESRYILKEEPTRFGCEKKERERGVKDDLKVLGLN